MLGSHCRAAQDRLLGSVSTAMAKHWLRHGGATQGTSHSGAYGCWGNSCCAGPGVKVGAVKSRALQSRGTEVALNGCHSPHACCRICWQQAPFRPSNHSLHRLGTWAAPQRALIQLFLQERSSHISSSQGSCALAVLQQLWVISPEAKVVLEE